MSSVKIGVIGGSGFYQMEGLTDFEEIEVDTPFGEPIMPIHVGCVWPGQKTRLPCIVLFSIIVIPEIVVSDECARTCWPPPAAASAHVD